MLGLATWVAEEVAVAAEVVAVEAYHGHDEVLLTLELLVVVEVACRVHVEGLVMEVVVAVVLLAVWAACDPMGRVHPLCARLPRRSLVTVVAEAGMVLSLCMSRLTKRCCCM